MASKLTDKLYLSFIGITLGMFLVVSQQHSSFAVDIVIPFIEGNKVFMHVWFTAIWIPIMVISWLGDNQKIRFDGILLCLFIKCFLDMLPVFRLDFDTSSFFGFYLNSVVALVMYFVFLQYRGGNYYTIIKLFAWFALILSIQVFWTASINQISFLDILYKSYMRIPFAASNIISSAILPIFFLAKVSLDSSVYRTILLSTMFLGVIFTKSRGGTILMVMWLVLSGFIGASKRNDRYIIYFCFVLVIVLGGFMAMSQEAVIDFLMGYANQNELSLNVLTTGRISLFVEEIREGFNSFVFGRGLIFDDIASTGAHNLLVDLFVKSGFVGLLNYVIALFLIISKKKYIESPYEKGLYMFLVVTLLNSMIEVCYFNYINDVLFWLAAGLFMSSISVKEVESNTRCIRYHESDPLE